MNWIKTTLVKQGVINQQETTLFRLVDTIEEAEEVIKELWAIQQPYQKNYREANGGIGANEVALTHNK